MSVSMPLLLLMEEYLEGDPNARLIQLKELVDEAQDELEEDADYHDINRELTALIDEHGSTANLIDFV